MFIVRMERDVPRWLQQLPDSKSSSPPASHSLGERGRGQVAPSENTNTTERQNNTPANSYDLSVKHNLKNNNDRKQQNKGLIFEFLVH